MISRTDTPSIIMRPMIPVCIAVAAGIATGDRFPGMWVWAVLCGVIALICAGRAIVSRRTVRCAPLALCFWCGYVSIQPWVSPCLPENHVAHICNGEAAQLQGTALDGVQHRNGRWWFVLAAEQLTRKGQTANVCGRVRVTGRGAVPHIAEGDAVTFGGRLRPIRNFGNPGGFDAKRHMALKGIHARIYARKGSLRHTPRSTKKRCGLDCMAQAGRNTFERQMADALTHVPQDTFNLLRALLLGDRKGVPTDLRQRFTRAGVAHVLAISGLHVGMVATVFFAAARWLFAWLPVMLSRAWTAKCASLISMAAVAGYGVMAGLSASTQRAMVMAAVLLSTYWVGRRYDWLNALAVAALAIMVAHPPALLGISFQLSFMAVLALIAGAVYFAEPQPKHNARWRRHGRRIILLVRVSALATAGTLPLVIYYFNQVSLVGIPVNLVVVPLVGTVVLPMGLAAMLAGSVGLDPIAMACWMGSAAAMGLVIDLVQWAADLPWSAVRCFTPTVFEIALYYGTGAVVIFWKRLRNRHWFALACVLLWTADGGYWVHQRYLCDDLRITVIDVGQGSAALLELPGGKTVLADGGGFSDNASFDVGRRIIAPLLWKKRIATIDLMVLSHPNSDHLNGLLFILETFTVRNVWDNGEAVSTAGYARWRRLIARIKATRIAFEHLPRRWQQNGVTLDILAPPPGFLRQSAMAPWRDVNNNSLVFKVTYGAHAVLFTGDIGAPAERDLIKRHVANGLRSSVLVVPHHGSGGSSCRAFIEAVGAAHAIISCGWKNRFGFPHPAVMKRLNDFGCRTWSTARHGAIEVVLDGSNCHVHPWRQ